MSINKNCVYILQCADQTLYTGWSQDLDHRLRAHNSGNGAKYTKARLPVILVYHEDVESKSEALKREIQIKKLTRQQKLALIARQKEMELNADQT